MARVWGVGLKPRLMGLRFRARGSTRKFSGNTGNIMLVRLKLRDCSSWKSSPGSSG